MTLLGLLCHEDGPVIPVVAFASTCYSLLSKRLLVNIDHRSSFLPPLSFPYSLYFTGMKTLRKKQLCSPVDPRHPTAESLASEPIPR